MSTLSFNGNKIVTCGGGGMVITKSESLAKKAKNLTTTSKRSHPWEFYHDELAYNYRLPNLNAALGVAQMKRLSFFIDNKRETANFYEGFFNNTNVQFLKEPRDAKSNYWLNAIRFENEKEKNDFLSYSNEKGVMARPLWALLSDLPMYKEAQRDSLKNAKWHYSTIVNIPSSVRI
jgi:dTDP-4-amino-4,6-dideoxygalactose transaminase